MTLSRRLFSEDPQIRQCRAVVLAELKNNYGHGADHGEKVAVEAGALICIEAENFLRRAGERNGGSWRRWPELLHDLRRGEGSRPAGSRGRGEDPPGVFLSGEEAEMIVEAIANQEAFVEPKNRLHSGSDGERRPL
jgi:hypothetical protein